MWPGPTLPSPPVTVRLTRLVETARFHKQALRVILENRRETRPLGPYGHLLTALRSKCPELIEPDRWQQAVKDADNFLATWGEPTHALGWTIVSYSVYIRPRRCRASTKWG